jgi:hypothetical protein
MVYTFAELSRDTLWKGERLEKEERVHIRILSTNIDMAQNSRVDSSKYKGKRERHEGK